MVPDVLKEDAMDNIVAVEMLFHREATEENPANTKGTILLIFSTAMR